MSKVKFFDGINYSGQSFELEPGRYLRDKLGANDVRVYSIEVPSGWKVTLWDGAGCTGRSTSLSKSTPHTDSGSMLLYSGLKTCAATVVCPAAESLIDVAPSLGFLGNSTYLDLGPLAIDDGGVFRGLTVEAWVWFDSMGRHARILELWQNFGHDNIFLARAAGTSSLSLFVIANNSQNVIYAQNAITNGQWMHVAATIGEDGTGRIYCNGVELGSGPVGAPSPVLRHNALVGRSAWENDAHFAGQMADLRVWSFARTQGEIRRTMNQRLVGNERGLVRYLRLDDWAGATVIDSSGTRNATIGGEAPIFRLAGPVLAEAAPRALQFDGDEFVTLPPLSADFSRGFAVEAWVNFSGARSFERIVDLGNGAGLDNILFARSGVSSTLYAHVFSGDRNGYVEAPGVLVAGTFLHLALTMSDVGGDGMGQLSIYVNGELRGSGRVPAPRNVVRNRAYIGKSNWPSDTHPFAGAMTELRLWSRPRTQAEIQAGMFARQDPAEPGIVAYYPLDDDGAKAAQDVSPNGLNGVLASAFNWREPGPESIVPMLPPSAALALNGVDTHVRLAARPDWFMDGFTIELWAYFTEIRSFARFVDLGNGPGADAVLFAFAGDGNGIYAHIFRGEGQSAVSGFVVAPGLLPTCTWLHLAMTVSPVSDEEGLLTLYVNGEARASGLVPMPRHVWRFSSLLGKSNWPGDPLFRGCMAEVRVWRVARSQAELRSAMNSRLTGSEDGLIRYHRFDESGGDRAIDASVPRLGTPWYSNIYPARLEGGWQRIAPLSPFVGVALDGHSDFVQLPPLADDFSQGFTVELWANIQASSSYARFLDIGNGAGLDSILFARDGATDSMYVHVFRENHAAPNGFVRAPNVLHIGVWQHVAATLRPTSNGMGRLTLYVNGEARGSGDVPMPRGGVTRTSCFVGKSNWSDPLLCGRITEVRLWNVARAPSELRRTMSRRLTGSEPGLCRYYPLDEPSGDTVRDLTVVPAGAAAERSARLFGERKPVDFPWSAPPPTLDEGSLTFDQRNAFVDLPALGFDYAAGFTFEAWVHCTSADDMSLLTLSRGASGDAISVDLRGTPSPGPGAAPFRFGLTEWRGGVKRSLSAQVPRGILGAWVHFAVTLDDQGAVTLHVDGVRLPDQVFINQPAIAAPLLRRALYQSCLGKNAWGGPFGVGSANFQGRLCEVRIYCRVRTEAELRTCKSSSLLINDRSLVAYYRLDDKAGTVAHDSSGSGRHASVRRSRVGDPIPMPLLAPPPGAVASLGFNRVLDSSSSDFVALPPVTADFSRGFTIEAWVRFDRGFGRRGGIVPAVIQDPNKSHACLVHIGNGQDEDGIILAHAGTMSDLSCRIHRGDVYAELVATGVLGSGGWEHLAATFGDVQPDGAGLLTLYVNGEARASQRVPGPVAGVVRRSSFLGRSGDGAIHRLFQGAMAEVRLWTIARSADQIQWTRNARLRGDEPGLHACYRLNEQSGSWAFDCSRQRQHATIRGAAGFGPDIPWGGLGSAASQTGGIVTAAGQTGVLRLDGQRCVALPPLAALPAPGLTLETWVQLGDIAGSGRFIDLGNGRENEPDMDNLYIGHEGAALVFGVQVGAQATQVVTAPGALAPGQWIHVAASLNEDGHVVLCKNGVPLSIDLRDVTVPAAVARSSAWLGRSRTGALLSGRLAEARIFSVARTPRQIAASMAQGLGAGVDGLVRAYPLAATHGAIAHDLAAGLHGAVHGEAAWDVPGPTLFALAPSGPQPASAVPAGGGALVFDGASTYVRLPELTLDLSAGFTVEAWVCFSAVGPYTRILDIGNGPGLDSILFAREAASNNLYLHIFRFEGANINSGYVRAPDVLALGTWQHLAATLLPTGGGVGQLTLYVDGVARASDVVLMPNSVTRRCCYVGKSNWPADALFEGRMAEVRLWTRARTEAELRATMATRLVGAERGLAFVYALNASTGETARNTALSLGDARVLGDRSFGSGPQLAEATLSMPPIPRPPAHLPAVSLIAGAAPGDLAFTSGASFSSGNALVDAALSGSASGGVAFDLFGADVALRVTGTATVRPIAATLTLCGSFELYRPISLSIGPATLVVDSSRRYNLRFAPSFSLAELVQQASPSAPVSAALSPFVQLAAGGVFIVSNSDGSDDELGDYISGLNVYVPKRLREVPGLSDLVAILPGEAVKDLPIVLSLGVGRSGDFKVAGTVSPNIAVIDTSPLRLVFNQMSLSLAVATRSSSLGVSHRFTLTLLGEELVFSGGLSLDQGTSGANIGVWAALDPARHTGGRWNNPWGFPGLSIGGFGVQLQATATPPGIGIGARGEISIGDGLLGGSLAISINPARFEETILAIASKEGLDLPALLRALLPFLDSSAQAFLSSLLAIRIKDLELYFAPNGGTIAGRSYEPGISIRGRLDVWGWRASIFGCVDKIRGGILQGNADPLRVSGAGVSLVEITDASGSAGPQVNLELTLARQGIFYSGRLSLLGGVYTESVELAVSGSEVALARSSLLGAFELRLDLRTGYASLVLNPRLHFSFAIAGIDVNLGVSARIENTVDGSGYRQRLSCSVEIAGNTIQLGPVAWSVTLRDGEAVLAAFEYLFGDLVKGFFADILAGALRQTVEWVKNFITAQIEEVVALFKAAGAEAGALAKSVVDVFGAAPADVIALVGTPLAETARILKEVFQFSAEQTARTLVSTFGATRDGISVALSGAGYVTAEVESAVNTVGDAFASGWRWFSSWF